MLSVIIYQLATGGLIHKIQTLGRVCLGWKNSDIIDAAWRLWVDLEVNPGRRFQKVWLLLHHRLPNDCFCMAESARLSIQSGWCPLIFHKHVYRAPKTLRREWWTCVRNFLNKKNERTRGTLWGQTDAGKHWWIFPEEHVLITAATRGIAEHLLIVSASQCVNSFSLLWWVVLLATVPLSHGWQCDKNKNSTQSYVGGHEE